MNRAANQLTPFSLVFFFPFPMVARIKLERRARIALYELFCLGLLTLGMSLSRLIVFMRAAVGEADPKLLCEFSLPSGNNGGGGGGYFY